MVSEELIFTLAYVLVSFCFLHPPSEFVSAGLTVQNLLGNFLGSEEMNFVYYHIKRTTATVIIHSLLPLGESLPWFTSARSLDGTLPVDSSCNFNSADLSQFWSVFLFRLLSGNRILLPQNNSAETVAVAAVLANVSCALFGPSRLCRHLSSFLVQKQVE